MHEDRLRSETRALDALIQKTVAQAQASKARRPADRMLFLGNRHQSFPTAVVKDPVLEPVDKLVWMVILLFAGETGGSTHFPGYEAIGRMANVSSRSTIARAMAILRLTRWLTLCARVRQRQGRFCSTVYALHDEPLPLVDALHIDRGYLAFVTRSLSHGHGRVRVVAQAVFDSIDEDILKRQDPVADAHLIERRIESTHLDRSGAPRRFFSFTHNVVKRLRSDAIEQKEERVHRDQKSNSVWGQNSTDQNSNSSSSSSNKNNNKTTTIADIGTASKFILDGEDHRLLVYPKRLCPDHREVAACFLKTLSPDQRQPLLDELAGRFQAERMGMTPVFDELSFLHSLCQKMRQGTFVPNLGLKVRDRRRQQEIARQLSSQSPDPLSAKETEAQWQARKASGLQHLAKLKTLLGRQETVKRG